MSIKNISFLSLLLTANSMYCNELSTGLIITQVQEKKQNQCTGKVAKQKPPLFIQAEAHEQEFINARTQCLEARDCDINSQYEQARYDIVYSILELVNHLENLNTNTTGVCNMCEKTEAKDLKKRLTELLKTAQ